MPTNLPSGNDLVVFSVPHTGDAVFHEPPAGESGHLFPKQYVVVLHITLDYLRMDLPLGPHSH